MKLKPVFLFSILLCFSVMLGCSKGSNTDETKKEGKTTQTGSTTQSQSDFPVVENFVYTISNSPRLLDSLKGKINERSEIISGIYNDVQPSADKKTITVTSYKQQCCSQPGMETRKVKHYKIYTIVNGINVSDMMEIDGVQFGNEIRDKWFLYGSPTVIGTNVYQPMVKYE